MKRFLLIGIATLGLLAACTEEQLGELSSKIPDNMEQAFPDPVFRAYVMENFDTDKDGKISEEEAAAVTEIDVTKYSDTPDNERIASLEGVQYFANLSVLYCIRNQLTSLDMSNNTELETLYCSDNQLTNIDLSKNTKLKFLMCLNNQLTSLDVSKNKALELLVCNNNLLTSLDVSSCQSLKSLSCGPNKLTNLDVSKNTELTTLVCGANMLTNLDVSNNTALIEIKCTRNMLTSLDLSKNAALESLDCSSNQLTDLDLSKNTELRNFVCGNNLLTTLDISNTNLGNLRPGTSSMNVPSYFSCSPMDTLKTLYIKSGWNIENIYFIPEHTEVIYID